jgi:hypothetical protein
MFGFLCRPDCATINDASPTTAEIAASPAKPRNFRLLNIFAVPIEYCSKVLIIEYRMITDLCSKGNNIRTLLAGPKQGGPMPNQPAQAPQSFTSIV